MPTVPELRPCFAPYLIQAPVSFPSMLVHSLAHTSYPSSHKLLLIIADGIIRGENEDRTAPDICLDMMTDFVVRHEEVEPQSYIAIADGSKRHNMAKIYTGYYKYTDDCEMPMEERQKVPMIVIVKCGTPAEAKDKKPGNRGKRDFQIILMSFLQKVMFDERMTKGPTRNWVPVLANPDIVEHYSENVVDTLHKKTCCSWARTVI